MKKTKAPGQAVHPFGVDLDQLKASLEPGHVLHTMLCEHEAILGFLRDLEEANRIVQGRTRLGEIPQERERLRSISSHLIGAESHHKREEDVLFPELERRGFAGPPAAMRAEHEELRRRKHHLQNLASGANETNFESFRSALNTVSRGLVFGLQNHIDKENHILYPLALKVIPERSEWARMRADCDRIGYCCFTPKV